MLEGIFLSAALAIGQAPAQPMPMPIPGGGAAPAPLKVESQPAAPGSAAPAAQPTIIWEQGGNGTGNCCPEEEKSGPSTLLMKRLQGTGLGCFLEERKTTISGFVDLRYTASNSNLGRIPTGMGFSFNQHLPQFNWVTVERQVDPNSTDPSFGYRFDTILFGSTYQYTLPRGLWNRQLTQGPGGNPDTLGIDPVQHYLEWYFPGVVKGLDVQVGRRFARFGYESLNPTQTVLPSYSYAFTFNPYTYTGVFTELKLTDSFSVINDFSMGPDIWFDSAARFSWLGALRWAGEKASIQGSLFLGHGRFDVREAINHPQFIDVVYTQKFGCDDKWQYAFEFLYGWQNGVPGVGFAEWFHYVNYLTYNWTDKFSTTGRVEFFDDRQGNRTGFAGLYNSFTLGSTWRPADWLMIRPEVRYDHHSDARPFDNQRDFFGFTINGIVLW